MATYKIEVTIDYKTVSVDPESLVMTSGDQVYWGGTTPRKFSILFGSASPFAASQLGHAAAIVPQQPQSMGLFKYTVVAEDDPNVLLDPIIVVEEPPSGGNP